MDPPTLADLSGRLKSVKLALVGITRGWRPHKFGLNRDLNPGPLAPKARIIPLDHWAVNVVVINPAMSNGTVLSIQQWYRQQTFHVCERFRSCCSAPQIAPYVYITAIRDWRHDEVAEWLRRWTANPLGSARVGSNPILVEALRFYGVMVSILDFESSDPSSNLGRTAIALDLCCYYCVLVCNEFNLYTCWLPKLDPDVNWTRNLLIWSQTRYHCATESYRSWVPISGISTCLFGATSPSKLIPPGLEPGTLRVLGARDNHYTTESMHFLAPLLKPLFRTVFLA